MAKGDHIYVSIYTNNTAPYHHGIDCGNDTVIHYQKNYKNEKNGIILWVSMKDFTKGRKIYTRIYNNCDSPLIVVERAKRRLGETKYNLFYNNCEHFARYCKTGVPISDQVENYKDLIFIGNSGIAASDALVNNGKSIVDTSQNLMKKTLDTISSFWNF
ncbi:lecithin retinol acyltransferase family protein [Nostoc sp. FACHB-280]|uniref:lecithin retinol acyltransferase family protein n=1 Tax=Nostoc sp. FACHB-280 TaxID=2692839 RepID=UPI00168B8FD5|nr:lecithin retinol acyltransferase family protein [Nostoc sp. FACHB-280]MBD2498564.1 lecithin retinol acyltransferase family protein [Nostoc sp. FACHB-280]